MVVRDENGQPMLHTIVSKLPRSVRERMMILTPRYLTFACTYLHEEIDPLRKLSRTRIIVLVG